MKQLKKVYLEITNRCNLSCSFCAGTKRTQGFLSPEQFRTLAEKIRPHTEYLYLHLMGEPLCHPLLGRFLELAHAMDFRVNLTTNGTLLPQKRELLLESPGLHKVNISLHAFEANDFKAPFSEYLQGCFAFGQAAQGKVLTVYRLWNRGGRDERNEQILAAMHDAFPGQWQQKRQGIRIGDGVYLQHGDRFDWPDLTASQGDGRVFCYGLRDQIGILCDGTVVPCCLDHEGDMALGNLFRQELGEILAAPRAAAIYDGFSNRTAAEELCRRCGYARRFG